MSRDPSYKEKYLTNMRLLIDRGYAQEIPRGDMMATLAYYIPHSAVEKDSETTHFA